MILKPISNTLYQDILNLSNSGIWLHGKEQIKIGNYLINTSFGPKECLLLDDSGVVIDGFVISRKPEYMYNGKPFYELLGGKLEYGMTSNPLSEMLYVKTPINLIIPHIIKHQTKHDPRNNINIQYPGVISFCFGLKSPDC